MLALVVMIFKIPKWSKPLIVALSKQTMEAAYIIPKKECGNINFFESRIQIDLFLRLIERCLALVVRFFESRNSFPTSIFIDRILLLMSSFARPTRSQVPM